MSTTGPVFLRPAMEIRERADPLCRQSGGEQCEGRRAEGSKGERVVFLGGNIAQTVFCNRHGHLGPTAGALAAYYVC